MSDDAQEEETSETPHFVRRLSERMLESDKNANVLILILVLIATISFLSIGITATRVAAPAGAVELSE